MNVGFWQAIKGAELQLSVPHLEVCGNCHGQGYLEQPGECPQCHGRKLDKQWSVPARPKAQDSALPMGGCDPSLPPCGPACRRWPDNG